MQPAGQRPRRSVTTPGTRGSRQRQVTAGAAPGEERSAVGRCRERQSGTGPMPQNSQCPNARSPEPGSENRRGRGRLHLSGAHLIHLGEGHGRAEVVEEVCGSGARIGSKIGRAQTHKLTHAQTRAPKKKQIYIYIYIYNTHTQRQHGETADGEYQRSVQTRI